MSNDSQLSVSEKIMDTTNSIEHKPSQDIILKLQALINELINTDFNTLVQLLYRIDINEKKLKELLAHDKNTDAAVLIAELIIKRQLQKIETKKQFRNAKNSEANDSW